jgi:hypothetical protein
MGENFLMAFFVYIHVCLKLSCSTSLSLHISAVYGHHQMLSCENYSAVCKSYISLVDAMFIN